MRTYTITNDCIGCTLCARNCPVKAISGLLKQQHEIDENACVRCGLCGRVCAAGAVLDPHGNRCVKVPKAQWPRAVFDDDCAACSLCIINCPKHCIELEEPAFAGDIHIRAHLARPDDCIGCGLCVDACPIEAAHLERTS